MLPLKVSHHFNHLRIAADAGKLVLELREDDEVFQSIKEPVCRVRLSAADLASLATALQLGQPGKFGKRNWLYGQVLEVHGRPPAGLSWRKAGISKWFVPFRWSWRPYTIPGKFVSAIAEVATFVQANPGLLQSSATKPGPTDAA